MPSSTYFLTEKNLWVLLQNILKMVTSLLNKKLIYMLVGGV